MATTTCSSSSGRRRAIRADRETSQRLARLANTRHTKLNKALARTSAVATIVENAIGPRYSRVPLSQARAFFYRSLTVLIGSGVPLTRSLQVLSVQTEHRRLAEAVQSCLKGIDAGHTLSAGMGKNLDVFTQLEVAMVGMAEQTGMLHMVLERLATHTEKSSALRNKVSSALVYPCFIFVLCMAMLFLVPMVAFKGLLAFLVDSNVPLPLSTRILVFLTNTAPLWLLLMVISPFLLRRARPYLERLPGIKPALKAAASAEFFRSMATMYSSGVPVLKGLDLARAATSNRELREGLGQARAAVMEGRPLHQALEDIEFFNPWMLQLLAVGEQTGQVAPMMERVSKVCDESVDAAITSGLAALQPLMMGLMGLIVGFVVLATMTPLVKMAQSLL